MQYIVIDLVYHNREALMGSRTIFQRLERPPTQTPTQTFEIGFSILSSQVIGSNLVLFKMIFKALQSDSDSYSLISRILIIPELHNENLYNMKLPLKYS